MEEAITRLASACGCDEPSDLFSQELSTLMEEYYNNHMDWEDETPERFMFALLCRRAQEAVIDHWDHILEIVGDNCVETKGFSL